MRGVGGRGECAWANQQRRCGTGESPEKKWNSAAAAAAAGAVVDTARDFGAAAAHSAAAAAPVRSVRHHVHDVVARIPHPARILPPSSPSARCCCSCQERCFQEPPVRWQSLQQLQQQFQAATSPPSPQPHASEPYLPPPSAPSSDSVAPQRTLPVWTLRHRRLHAFRCVHSCGWWDHWQSQGHL